MSRRRLWFSRVFVVVFGVLLLGLASSPAFRAGDQSRVEFECFGDQVDKPARGHFATILSNLVVDPGDLRRVQGSVAVELASIVTKDATWDVLFRAAPFLGIQEYPRSYFELERAEGAAALRKGKPVDLSVVGRFHLKGESRPLRFPARVVWRPRTRGQPESVHVKGAFQIKWADFGVRIPAGAAARFAGEGTHVRVDLLFERMRPRRKVTRSRSAL